MGILLAFAPFIGFAVVDRLADSFTGLMAGVCISGALMVRDLLTEPGSAKLLDVGSFLLFAGLVLYSLTNDPAWSIIDVRLRVDIGLCAITAASILLRRPFTLQYAREQVPPELWETPHFLRTNFVISCAWLLAFALMVLADLAMRHDPAHFQRLGIATTIAVLVAAMKFTGWYPRRAAAA